MRKSYKIKSVILLIFVLNTLSVFGQRFAILSDIHVTPGNENSVQLKLAIDEINKSDVSAVIVSGDLTNEGSDEQLTYVKSILDDIEKPYYAIPGNHENNWSQSACQTFSRLWGADRFYFIVDSLLVIGTNCGPFMKMGDGHVNPNDLTWLSHTLRNVVKPGMRVLSVNHYPLRDEMDNNITYQNILMDYPVVAHLHGHFHKWMQYKAANGIESVGVRALDMKDVNRYGYTLMDVTHDSIYVWEKPIGHEKELKFCFAVSKMPFEFVTHKTDGQNFAIEPFEINPISNEMEEDGFGASIFTRVVTDKDGVSYYGTSKGHVVAIKDGRELWRRSHLNCGMLFSRPAVTDKNVVVSTGDSRLILLNRKQGIDFPEAFDLIDMNRKTGKDMAPTIDLNGPVVADGIVVDNILYQGGYEFFGAWDVDNDKLLWMFDSIDNYCQAAPVVDKDDVIFGAWDGYLRCLDKKTGELKWKWSNGNPGAHLFSPGNVVPAVFDDRVIIVAPDRYATCLDRTTGKEIWRHFDKNVKVRESLGRSEDGQRAYAKTMDGTIVAIDATTDYYHELWNTDVGFGYEHAPCALLEHKGFVYAGSRRGVIAIVEAKTGKLVYRECIGYSEINGFDLDHNGNVICSLIEGKVFCITHK